MESHQVQKLPMLTIFNSEEKMGMAKVICDLLSKLAGSSSTERFLKRLVTLVMLSDSWQAEDKDDGKNFVSKECHPDDNKGCIKMIEENNQVPVVNIDENNEKVYIVKSNWDEADEEDNWEVDDESIPDEAVRQSVLTSRITGLPANDDKRSTEITNNFNSNLTFVSNKRFKSKTRLKTGRSRFTCKACRVNFATEDRFARHMARRHEPRADNNRVNVGQLIKENKSNVDIDCKQHKIHFEGKSCRVELIRIDNMRIDIREDNQKKNIVEGNWEKTDEEDNWAVDDEDIPDEAVGKSILTGRPTGHPDNDNKRSTDKTNNFNSNLTFVNNKRLKSKKRLKTGRARFTCKACRVNFATEDRFARHMARRHELRADDNRVNVEQLRKEHNLNDDNDFKQQKVHFEEDSRKENTEEDIWEDDNEEDIRKIDDGKISLNETINKNTSSSSNRSTNGKIPFTGKTCHSNFTTKTGFACRMAKRHVSRTRVATPCEHCGLMCASLGILQRHIRRMHEATLSNFKKLSCDVCGREFLNDENLKRHMMYIHTREREWVCSICGKLFGKPGHYKLHMRTHSGERPFDCKVCCKRFFTRGQLTVHMRSHSGLRPYRCMNCGRSYTRADVLKTHSCKPG